MRRSASFGGATSGADSASVAPLQGSSVLVLTNVLPVRLRRLGPLQWDAEWEIDGRKALVIGDQSPRFSRVRYVGCPPCFVPPAEEEAVERALQPFDCHPVFLSKDVAHKHFQGYCSGVLWPTFHSVVDVYNHARVPGSASGGTGTDTDEAPEDEAEEWAAPRSWSPSAQDRCWPAYCAANRAVASKVVELFQQGDTVWVHGLPLLLVPSYLLRRLRHANVGLFLDAPFPPSAVFMALANRDELLRSMLNVNHLGFPLFEFARNFFTCCKIMLGHLTFKTQPGGSLAIDYHGRNVAVTCMHRGVDSDQLRGLLARRDLGAAADAIRERYRAGVDFLVCGVDRFEGLRGISLKLLAFDRFLSSHPSLCSRVRLLQVGYMPEARPDDSNQTRAEVLAMVRHINAKWGPDAVVLQEVDQLTLEHRLAVWSASDILLSTPVRAGHDPYPFEFLLAHEHSQTPAVMIISEFSSCSAVLSQALRINPWNVEQVVMALGTACSMPLAERVERHSEDLAYALNNSCSTWAQRMLADVQQSFSATGASHTLMGFGLAYRFQQPTKARRLEVDSVVEAYRRCRRRLIFVDLVGTLVAGEPEAEHRAELLRPSKECMSLLRGLCADSRNRVFVVGAGTRETLEAAMGSVPQLGLVANSGFYTRWPGSAQWEAGVDEFPDPSWREAALDIMLIYNERTNGSTVTTTDTSASFDYARSDAEFGALQGNQLVAHLGEVLDAYGLSITHHDCRVEVNPGGANKGAAVTAILDRLDARGAVDFVLSVGDDFSDEAAFELVNDAATKLGVEDSVWTVTVGKRPTAATWYVDDIGDVTNLLTSLARKALSGNRSLSVADLKSLSPLHAAGDERSAGGHSGAQRRLNLQQKIKAAVTAPDLTWLGWLLRSWRRMARVQRGGVAVTLVLLLSWLLGRRRARGQLK